eukprot:GEMP01098337.1.p1 GENE.GEMP01098337.1~~GEMP01098337.1.p1  ORF type:complete len:171 (+),score=35.26 GEMP01098337.1:82-594(+)
MLAFRTVRPARVTLRAFAHYELPALPWAKNALAPHISEETIDFHYGKHHKTYVDKLNGLTKDSNTPLEELCKTSSGAIFNNAAQIYNHTFYWNSLSPNGGGNPTGKLLEKINQDFGSVDNFKKEFSAAAHRDRNSAAHLRRVGARVLYRPPKPAPEIPGKLVEFGELAMG